jgi:hypothetical protein
MMKRELAKLNAEKTAKEKEWYSKMSGFYSKDKLSKIESEESQMEQLREKIQRQVFNE